MINIRSLDKMINFIFRCVDKLYVWSWPDGTQKTGSAARKLEVQPTQTSVIVDVEACIGYRYCGGGGVANYKNKICSDFPWSWWKTISGRIITGPTKFSSRPLPWQRLSTWTLEESPWVTGGTPWNTCLTWSKPPSRSPNLWFRTPTVWITYRLVSLTTGLGGFYLFVYPFSFLEKEKDL